MTPVRDAKLADPGGIVGWDLRVARAAAIATVLGFALALVVTAATDEGGVAWGERFARTLPALPACAGFGAWVALQARRARGELRVLATLGRSPARASLAAFVGAAAAGALVTVGLTTRPSFDASAFFPKAQSGIAVHFEGGVFVEDATGLRFRPDGSIQKPPPAATPPAGSEPAFSDPRVGGREGRGGASPRTQRVVGAFVVLFATLSFALFGARGTPRRKDWAAIAAAATLTVVVLHGASAARVPSPFGVAPTIGLFAFAIIRYGEDDEAWSNAV